MGVVLTSVTIKGVIVNRLKELNHEDILLGLSIIVEPVEELGDADIVLLQEGNDVHALPILHVLLGHVEELSYRDVVVVGLRVLVQVLLEELNNGHVHVVLVHSVRLIHCWGAIQVLGHSNAVLCVQELRDGDLILIDEAFNSLVVEEEATDSSLQELSH